MIHQEVNARCILATEFFNTLTRVVNRRATLGVHNDDRFGFPDREKSHNVVNVHVHARFCAITVAWFEEGAFGVENLCLRKLIAPKKFTTRGVAG